MIAARQSSNGPNEQPANTPPAEPPAPPGITGSPIPLDRDNHEINNESDPQSTQPGHKSFTAKIPETQRFITVNGVTFKYHHSYQGKKLVHYYYCLKYSSKVIGAQCHASAIVYEVDGQYSPPQLRTDHEATCPNAHPAPDESNSDPFEPPESEFNNKIAELLPKVTGGKDLFDKLNHWFDEISVPLEKRRPIVLNYCKSRWASFNREQHGDNINPDTQLSEDGLRDIYISGRFSRKSRIHIFGSTQMLAVCATAKVLHIDCTFFPAPKGYAQVMTIGTHVTSNQKDYFCPVLIAVLPDKTQITYSRVFVEFKLALEERGIIQPSVVKYVCDFEVSLMNAIMRKLMRPGDELQGCYFHFCKDVKDRFKPLVQKSAKPHPFMKLSTKVLKYLPFLSVNEAKFVVQVIINVAKKFGFDDFAKTTKLFGYDFVVGRMYVTSIWQTRGKSFPELRTNNNSERYNLLLCNISLDYMSLIQFILVVVQHVEGDVKHLRATNMSLDFADLPPEGPNQINAMRADFADMCSLFQQALLSLESINPDFVKFILTHLTDLEATDVQTPLEYHTGSIRNTSDVPKKVFPIYVLQTPPISLPRAQNVPAQPPAIVPAPWPLPVQGPIFLQQQRPPPQLPPPLPMAYQPRLPAQPLVTPQRPLPPTTPDKRPLPPGQLPTHEVAPSQQAPQPRGTVHPKTSSSAPIVPKGILPSSESNITPVIIRHPTTNPAPTPRLPSKSTSGRFSISSALNNPDELSHSQPDPRQDLEESDDTPPPFDPIGQYLQSPTCRFNSTQIQILKTLPLPIQKLFIDIECDPKFECIHPGCALLDHLQNFILNGQISRWKDVVKAIEQYRPMAEFACQMMEFPPETNLNIPKPTQNTMGFIHGQILAEYFYVKTAFNVYAPKDIITIILRLGVSRSPIHPALMQDLVDFVNSTVEDAQYRAMYPNDFNYPPEDDLDSEDDGELPDSQLRADETAKDVRSNYEFY